MIYCPPVLPLLLALLATPSPDPSPTPAPAPHDDGRRTMSRLATNLGRATVGMVAQQNLGPFVVGSAATALSSVFDDRVKESLAKPEDPASKAVGTSFGPVSAACVVGVFVGGRFASGERFRAASYDMAVAAGLNGVLTLGLKAATQRERPDGSNKHSFPSGHTSNAFALAAALDGQYGAKVTVPAYAIATLVGVSRMRLNKHWLSDTLAGATLGYIVGRTTARMDDKPLAAKTSIAVAPLLGPVKGLTLAIGF